MKTGIAVRQSIASIALIRTATDGRTLWLAQWNRNWNRYHLIGGHKRPDETFRECIVREVGEELDLAEHEGFFVAEHPVAHLEYTAWSEGAKEQTAYVMELFDLELCGAARRTVDKDPRNRWLSEAEIRAGRTSDGETVSTTMVRLLSEINWGRS